MSKYQPLTDYLLAHCNERTVKLSFDSIKAIIYPQTLPFSAYYYREWWANDAYHSQANAWYKAGFLVHTVSNKTVVFFNSNTNRSPIISISTPPQIKKVICPICKKEFDTHTINDHIRFEENNYFGNYIKFQSSKFVCGICYGIINNFSPSYLQAHKEKKCLDKKFMMRFNSNKPGSHK